MVRGHPGRSVRRQRPDPAASRGWATGSGIAEVVRSRSPPAAVIVCAGGDRRSPIPRAYAPARAAGRNMRFRALPTGRIGVSGPLHWTCRTPSALLAGERQPARRSFVSRSVYSQCARSTRERISSAFVQVRCGSAVDAPNRPGRIGGSVLTTPEAQASHRQRPV